jgi:hypothetical protein
MTAFDWTPIRYRNVISVLKNPFYAGAYAYGKSVHRTQIVDGRARKTYGHFRPLRDCEILQLSGLDRHGFDGTNEFARERRIDVKAAEHHTPGQGSSQGLHRLGGV